MRAEGKCLCGHVEFSAEIDPDKVIICHCSDCQRHAATAFGVVVGVVDEQFELTTGSMKTYVKTADSGTKRALTFCPECGTRIYSKTVGEGTSFMGLRVGTLERRAELTPKMQVFCRSAVPWLDQLPDFPTHEGSPGEAEVRSDKG
ncbi:MAG: GFA family protein [Rhizobiaceae bacterium]